MTADFHLRCAGAGEGLVRAVLPAFDSSAGVRLRARFGAVGAMRDELGAGAPCDVFVATEAMVAALAASGALRPGSTAAIGRVPTAIAVRADAPRPAIDSAESLRSTLLAAAALFIPDATRSTAGAHVVAVLERLGLREALAPRLRMHANGAAAMRELAAASESPAIGCTQATEIRYTPGLVLVGPLPAPCDLATVYSAAIGAGASDPEVARSFIALLAGPSSAGLREAGGFEALAAQVR
jgi:molybdate transport system substrate-binding protein